MTRESRRVRSVGLGVLAFAVGMLIAEVVSSIATGHPLGWYTQDPAATYDGDAIAGIQSQIGVLALTAAAAILFFSWVLSRSWSGSASGFLLTSALLSALLAVDDLFRLHDDLFVRLTGRSERVVFVLYGVAFAAWLLRYRRIILRPEEALLVAGIGLMGLALIADVLEHPLEAWLGETVRPFVEDGAKFLGFLFWSAGLTLHCLRLVESQRAPRPAPVTEGDLASDAG